MAVFDRKEDAVSLALSILDTWRGISARDAKYALMSLIMAAVRDCRPLTGAVTITDHGISIKALTEGELHIERV